MIQNYNKFVQLIKEGLIRTHNIYNYSSRLENNISFIGLNINLNIISKFRYEILIFNPIFLKEEIVLDSFLSSNNNLGYYPIRIYSYRNENNNFFNYSNDTLLKEINNKLTTKIKILFDAKYEDGIYSNSVEIPNVAYHLTPLKNDNSIKDNGLYPKSNSRKINHKDRVYLFINYEDYGTLLKTLKSNDHYNKNKQLYNLYEVLLTEKNILHTDPDMDGAFFTYDHISPKNIKLLKTDL